MGMKVLRRTLAALAGLLLADNACRAQGLAPVRSQWEASAVEKHGPARAAGLLLNIRGDGPDEIKRPVAAIFGEMARIAQWDILRINRRRYVDLESQDDEFLRFVAEQVTRARQDGYKQIIVAGVSSGGWLALLAATLPDVDAAIGLAPGTTTPERAERERARDVLAQKLAGARAKRIAAFFFDGDPLEDVDERRAVAVRRALQNTRTAFMVVDRPPDLRGPSAARGGRFVRRYRDCLLQFVRNVDQPPGEAQCSRSSGYAVGAEIGFPSSVPAPKLPDANRAFAPYWGRWEGDDENGDYLIMESVRVRPLSVTFRMGFSAGPGKGSPATGMRELAFEVDEARGRIVHMLPGGADMVLATLKSATKLEYEVWRRDYMSPGPGNPRLLLHKRGR